MNSVINSNGAAPKMAYDNARIKVKFDRNLKKKNYLVSKLSVWCS